MALPRLSLRIAVVQFCPLIGQVQANIARATELCAILEPRSIDLVCLPEMVFSGYVFSNSAHISPYLEQPRFGPTSQFCQRLAQQLECHVIAGYPEQLHDSEGVQEDVEINGNQTRVVKMGANSAVLYGPSGQFIGNYRKTNLYDTDKSWAKAGDGFGVYHLSLGTLCLGICMDLNPQPPALWSLKSGPYELADHCVLHRANILVLLNSWLENPVDSEEDTGWATINYWAARLRPLWDKASDGTDVQESGHDRKGSDTIVIVCNRTGTENGVKFAGSSALFRMRKGSGRPQLLNIMSKDEESIQIWDVHL